MSKGSQLDPPPGQAFNRAPLELGNNTSIDKMNARYLTTYQALPLDPNERKIRILHLLPGNDGDIQVELSILDLDNASGDYTCVSYVWGDATIRRGVWVDGEELAVTRNLFDLLHQVRHPHEVTTLWVDAVCINQEDIKERSHQVALMDTVYSSCSSVYIWLGHSPKCVQENPFYIFEHFANGKHYHDLPGYQLDSSGSWVFDGKDPGFESMWTAFAAVAENTWWTRAWTVQEVILPRRSTVPIGSWKTTYETISLARIKRDDQLNGCCAESRAAQPSAIRHKLDHFLGEVARIDRIHYPRVSEEDSEVAKILRSRSAYPFPPLYQISFPFAARNCRDPRDKVFSILGLTNGSNFSDFRPDYSASVEDCYKDFFTRMIQWSGGDYRTLLGTGFGPSLSGMPSWVRDFSRTYSPELTGQELRRLQVYDLYDCSAGQSNRLQVFHGSELRVQAVQQDVILTKGPTMSDIFDTPLKVQSVLQEWVRMTKAMSARFAGDEQEIHSRICRTLCADLRNDMSLKGTFWRRTTAEEIPSPTALQMLLDGDFSGLDDGFVPGVAMSTAGRALFIAESGHIGLCNPKSRPGDAINALIGANVPFVLRKVHDGDDGRTMCELIGDCFLFGYMDGEIMQAGNVVRDITLV
ncbi:hypothetical protein DHEL01_v212343 [Diaporthe helianthi]|uniref:Heterokaryon incompatibility domain-containing protein n=1 Tax=Diaporthe helianthi TaxID=158607 RepID=A0A2P5HG92_DIAHE|nr:hypothetical protein DHEL01_v212343 [Diaporthe helianthi]